MWWCHGHCKPVEIFRTPSKTYLTDFAHVGLYPEGMELAFIIWADWFMAAPWDMSPGDWQAGAEEWREQMTTLAKELGIRQPVELLRVSLCERLIGSILADVVASDRPRQEAEGRLHTFFTYLDRLLAEEV